MNYFLVRLAPVIEIDEAVSQIEDTAPQVSAFSKERFIANNLSLTGDNFLPILRVLEVIAVLVGSLVIGLTVYTLTVEHDSEYGVLKAIGASNSAIFLQFLAEALAVTVVSGLVGAGLGWLAVAAAAAGIGEGSTMASAPVLMPRAFVSIVLTMIVVGVAAGILPALRASRIDPAISLRAT